MLADKDPLHLSITESPSSNHRIRQFTVPDLRRMRLLHNLNDRELASVSRILHYLHLTQHSFESMLSRWPKLLKKFMETLLQDLCVKLRQRNESLDCDLSDLLPVAIFELNLSGNISFANRNGLSVFGYEESDFVEGLNFFQMLVPEDGARFRHRLRHLQGLEEQGQTEYSVLTKEGRVFPAAIHCDPISKGDQVCGWRITILDISERKKIEEDLRTAHNELELRVRERTARLQESEQRYALAVQGANDGIWDWNLLTDEIYFSGRWKSMIGLQKDQIGNRVQEWFERIHPDDLDQVKRAILLHQKGSFVAFLSQDAKRAKEYSNDINFAL